jgi:hypothetical protein
MVLPEFPVLVSLQADGAMAGAPVWMLPPDERTMGRLSYPAVPSADGKRLLVAWAQGYLVPPCGTSGTAYSRLLYTEVAADLSGLIPVGQPVPAPTCP